MNRHTVFLELAAAGLDFRLTGPEQTRLDAHLASCPACRARVEGLHADARSIAGLPEARLDPRRAAIVLDAALHGPARSPAPVLRLALVAALVGALAIGAALVGAEILRRMTENDISVVPPVPTASPGPEASPGPVPASELAWQEAVSIDDAGVYGIVSFNRGYVAYGESGDYQEPVVWHSIDGVTWTRISLASMVTNCPGAGPAGDELVPDATIRDAASNGTEILVVGAQFGYGEACSGGAPSMHPVAWVSSDGRIWRRSEVFGPMETTTSASSVWWSPGGWQARIEETGGIWGSGGGTEWIDLGWTAVRAGASSPDGTLVIELPGDVTAEPHQLAQGGWSGGVYQFKPIDLPTACEGQRDFIVPPVDDGGRWLLANGTATCSSKDLEEWTESAPAVPSDTVGTARALASTRYGAMMSVNLGCRDCPLPPVPWIQYVSTDGATWEAMASSVEALHIADGPSGVIALGPEGVVWRLTRTPVGPSSSPSPAPPGLGQAWTEGLIPTGVDIARGRVEAVTAGGPGFVAVGHGCVITATHDVERCDGIVWTTTDGREWDRVASQQALDTGIAIPLSGPAAGIFDVAAGPPGVVAIGYSALPDFKPTVWFSPDGQAWERMADALAVSGGGGARTDLRPNAVAWTGDRFVVVGEDRSEIFAWDGDFGGLAVRAAVWTSPDGRAWTRVADQPALEVGGFIDTMEDPVTGGMADVVAGPEGIVAVGSACSADSATCEPAAWISTDGVAWRRSEPIPVPSGVLESVAATGSGYVAVGAELCGGSPVAVPGECPALVVTSANGLTWTAARSPQPGYLREVSRIGDRLFASAPDGPITMWASNDGISWEPASVHGGPATGAVDEYPREHHLAAGDGRAVWIASDPDWRAWYSTAGN